MEVAVEVMYFGRHKGQSVSEVPTGYLVWCLDRVRRCPKPVIEELVRRGVIERPPEQVAKLTPMGEHVGERYEYALEAFVSAGGDTSACPFDTEDYSYSGPEVMEAGMSQEEVFNLISG
jgi:hypothetical protein